MREASKKLSKYLPSFGSSKPPKVKKSAKSKHVVMPFAYVRIKFSKLVENGWDKPPAWIIFKPNPCYRFIKAGHPLPSALLSCRIGTQANYPGYVLPTARPFLHIPKTGNLVLKITSATNLPKS